MPSRSRQLRPAATVNNRGDVERDRALPVTLDDLDRVVTDPGLLPSGTEVRALGPREYSLLAPGMRQPIRVTTDPAYYEGNSESRAVVARQPVLRGAGACGESADIPAGGKLGDFAGAVTPEDRTIGHQLINLLVC